MAQALPIARNTQTECLLLPALANRHGLVTGATGNLEGVQYEEIRYEGYGIGGAAIIVDTMTDNKVRTVAEVTLRPENTIELSGDDAAKMQKILDVLEDLDDVQEVYHNAAL